ncbi:MAG: cytochrome P450 [Acidimicrobiales bacterium]
MGLGDDLRLTELERDPDPILARMRAEEPVCWVPALDMWFVTRWDDVSYLEDHPELFTAATDPSFLARALGPNLLTTDPPEHTRVQSILAPPFQSSGRSGEFARDELKDMADAILDRLDGDRFDLMADYAQPLSAGALATVLGLGEYGFDRVWSWCEGLCADIANFENDPDLTALGHKAKTELGEAIAERVGDGEGDRSAISAFVEGGATVEEIINNVRLMISGGINEPRDGIGLVSWVLLTRPDLTKRVREDPRSMRRLVEEVLRVYSPVGTVTRQATQTTEIGECLIQEGDLVAGVLRSMNLDESHWERPEEIDLDRREGPHAAFALGAHRCLGEWLGRQEIRVGVERLFDRFPDLRLDPAGSVELHGFEFRGPRSLMVISS